MVGCKGNRNRLAQVSTWAPHKALQTVPRTHFIT